MGLSSPSRRGPWLAAAVLAGSLVGAVPAWAHPVPFSYLDVRLASESVDATLVVHVADVAHELGIEPADRLLDPTVVADHADAISALVARRLVMLADGRRLRDPWHAIEVLGARRSLQLRLRVPVQGVARLSIDGVLFPYDPNHRTFLNLHEGDTLSQHILDRDRSHLEYFAGTRQGRLAVVRAFIPSGIHHILIGPDHILFLVGLLLLGGSVRRLAVVVTGFTAGHSLTLSLAALNIVTPPAAIVEPVIALSIVYVGLDNLLSREGRDVRMWIALGFGLVHGFGFASVLRDMGLPGGALGWSLFSFNVGVELGQLIVVAVVATTLAALRARSQVLAGRLVLAGSLVVVAAGGFWFIERLGSLGGF